MKILYCTRLFSGLETSLLSGVWRPTGVPTIYKIIEELDKKHEVKFIFSVKDSGSGYISSWGKKKDCTIVIKGLTQSINVLSGIRFFPTWIIRKFAMILREVRQNTLVIFSVIRFKPDVIYCDHANIIIAAILSRYQNRIPVVFRVMGVYPFMRQSLDPKSIIHKVYKWAYCSPFDLVICTQDGSGVESWLHNAIRPGVKKEVLLNGVHSFSLPPVLDKRLKSLSTKKNIILFVGKLEKYKGCYEFVESILLLLKGKNPDAHGLIIGTGSERDKINRLVEESNCLDKFTFIDRLPHDQIWAAHEMSAIYVSMNHLGNLSNANLEAIQSNDCIIMPESQPEIGIDVITGNLLSGVVLNTPVNNPRRLSNVLDDLLRCRKKRIEMSEGVNIRKKDFLWTWKKRIDIEISLLESLHTPRG
jgi:glycosyltransferase involved in cell wall biosynthesis